MGNSQQKNRLQQQRMLVQYKKILQQKSKAVNKLRQQQRNLIKQVMPKQKLINQYTMDKLMLMNYNTFTCIDCQNFYNQQQRQPIMICKNQHSLCELCVKQKQKDKQTKCLTCRQQFKNMGKNRMLLHLISNKEELLAYVRDRDGATNQRRKNKLDVIKGDRIQVKLCRFPNFQELFQMNQHSLLKISPQPAWHTIRSQMPLQNIQISFTSLKVVNSVHNSLIFGVTQKLQLFQKGVIPIDSLAYHFNNGHIYDKLPTRPSFAWRDGGIAVMKSTNPVIQMIINSKQRTIKWIDKQQVLAQTIVPKYFQIRSLYVFVSIYHKGDMIVMNK